MANLIEKGLLLNFSLFLIASLYSKVLSKVFFINGIFFYLLLSVIKYKGKFYRHLFPATPLNLSMLVFFTAASLSTIFSLDPYYSHKILFNRYVLYIFFIWMGFLITQPKNNLNVLAGAFILSGIIIGSGGILDYLRTRTDPIITSFGVNIDISFYLTMAIPLDFMILFFVKNRLLKTGAAISLLLLLPCFLRIASRSAWIAGIFSTLLVIFLKDKKWALIMLILLITVGMSLPQNKKYRLGTILQAGVLADRSSMWQSALKIFYDHPALGAGPGMYEKLFDKYYVHPEDYKGYRYLHAHNTYLELLAEMGILGLSAFLGILLAFFKNAFRITSGAFDDRAILLLGLTGSIIGALIFNVAGTVIIVGVTTSAYFWFLLGVAAGIMRLEPKEKPLTGVII